MNAGENGSGPNVYDFKVNVDNVYLKAELKIGGEEVQLKRARFINGLVLVGLALLHDEDRRMANSEDDQDRADAAGEESNIEDRVETFTRAVAPVLLPMIESLASLEIEETASADASGDAA
jgi:hypothetical protein